MADKADPATAQVAGDPRPGSSSSSQPTANDGAQAQGNSPSGSSTSNQIPCQWAGCSEYHPTPEALYDHVCEKHVGRKSTNNLNLTCAWGNCHTTTVKRDHITSHIRVHVPLKPHKCDLCGKSFKRPQDLKKHVKTHAEDPNQGMRGQDGPSSRPHQNGYHGMPGPPRMDGYGYGGGMQTGHPVNYPYPTHGGGMHYVPTSHGGGAHGGHYGQVYYPAATPIGGHTFADGRDGGFAATQRLFDDMRRESFNPKDYGAVSNLLMGMQQYQLPIPMVGAGGGDYGVATSAGGGFYGTASMHAQDAPSFPNLRTKQDLLEINDILQKMTATAYENPSHLSFQPAVPTGAMDISVGHRHQRLSQSPPSSALPNTHATDAASEHGTTPALTPGSSAMSYTSERSPPATHSNTVSPTLPSYPILPSVADGSNMGPVDTLGTRYNSDVHRRYSGSNLQQRAPAARRGSVDMDVDTPAADRKGKSKRDPTIDPALGGATGSSSSSGSSSAASVASDDTATPGREEEAAHGFNLRLLENLKSFIAGKLERGEFENENGSRHNEDDDDDDDDDDERVRRALTQDQDADMEDVEDKAVPKPEVAYPELKI